MKRTTKSILALTLAAGMVISGAGTESSAAKKKPKLSKKKVSVTVGKKVTVKVKNSTKKTKVKWTLGKKDKKIISLSKKSRKGVTIKGKKKGKATIKVTIKVGKKTVGKPKIKVTVNKKKAPATGTSAPAAGTSAPAAGTSAPVTTSAAATSAAASPSASSEATPSESSDATPSASSETSASPSTSAEPTKIPGLSEDETEYTLNLAESIQTAGGAGMTWEKGENGAVIVTNGGEFGFQLPEPVWKKYKFVKAVITYKDSELTTGFGYVCKYGGAGLGWSEGEAHKDPNQWESAIGTEGTLTLDLTIGTATENFSGFRFYQGTKDKKLTITSIVFYTADAKEKVKETIEGWKAIDLSGAVYEKENESAYDAGKKAIVSEKKGVFLPLPMNVKKDQVVKVRMTGKLGDDNAFRMYLTGNRNNNHTNVFNQNGSEGMKAGAFVKECTLTATEDITNGHMFFKGMVGGQDPAYKLEISKIEIWTKEEVTAYKVLPTIKDGVATYAGLTKDDILYAHFNSVMEGNGAMRVIDAATIADELDRKIDLGTLYTDWNSSSEVVKEFADGKIETIKGATDGVRKVIISNMAWRANGTYNVTVTPAGTSIEWEVYDVVATSAEGRKATATISSTADGVLVTAKYRGDDYEATVKCDAEGKGQSISVKRNGNFFASFEKKADGTYDAAMAEIYINKFALEVNKELVEAK